MVHQEREKEASKVDQEKMLRLRYCIASIICLVMQIDETYIINLNWKRLETVHLNRSRKVTLRLHS